ncbi:chemotaxis protein CheW [Scopulibacillus cellulosilyticus]|uniref:Chemotaxis protein CheA n=1 Tax=Scopulibacillus cellulosilyticus TaxID=2665665 RepID=A0ABW2PW95_9BACL
MDMDQYIDIFIDESSEHLQNLNEKLLELENKPNKLTIINEIFRSAHTLKGMAASMEFEGMADLTHKMENVLDDLRNEQLTVTEQLMDTLFEAVDHLEKMISQISSGEACDRDTSNTVKKLEDIKNSQAEERETYLANRDKFQLQFQQLDGFQKSAVEAAASSECHPYQIDIQLQENCLLKSVRVFMVLEALGAIGEIIKTVPETPRLEEEDFDLTFSLIFLSTEESQTVKKTIMQISEIASVKIMELTLPSEQKQPETQIKKSEFLKQDEKKRLSPGTAGKTVRINLKRLDNLLNLFEELIIDRSRLEKITDSIENIELKDTVNKIARLSNQMQDIILSMRMEPVEKVFNRFPRMVRSLAKELDKKVKLIITGAETEVDRSVIDEIGDPIVHLLRNSLDHGIEKPEVRVQSGKEEEGTIELKAYQRGHFIYIEIRDDGSGIDRTKILSKAIENGLVTREESAGISNQQVFDFMFQSGFSTAEKVSDVSGRGVGLDVVKSKIESLGGRVSVQSVPGKGTAFTIQLPLTLSIIHALLIKVANETYALPVSVILETALLTKIDKQWINQQVVMTYKDKVVPFIDLHQYLSVPGESKDHNNKAVIIVQKSNKISALIADDILGHQEIVIKPLSKFFSHLNGFSGATILGDGQVALILDVV